MIPLKSKFKTSVNIKLDLGSYWIQDRYIPTPTHIESLTGILEGFLDYDKKSHILVGSYGSGKSMIGALISNIVSKNVGVTDINKLIAKFDKVNTEESAVIELLQKIQNHNKTFIPVVINGKQGRFREAVISSIHKSLKQFNLNFTLPSTVDEIKSKIITWREQFNETYKKFQILLEEKKWDLNVFLSDIEEYDIAAIDWFKEMYPSLTAGAEFTLSYNIDLNEHLSYILKELDGRGYGLFLVYDEFGRFLQSVDKYETVEAMQDIQDIAELADHHKSNNFNVLLITHRNLKQYFLSYGEELQNEFQRIQGRFRIYHTHSDPATFIRLSCQVTENYREFWNKDYYFESEIIKYDLFPELNGREKKSIIVENSFPLHPVTMFALPRLANAVAQNERTLFTFLESNEVGGLKRYFEVERTWYYPHNLFDYFEPAFQEFMTDSLIGRSYYKYLRVQKKVGNSPTANFETQLLKLITLWDISNLGNNQKLTKEFMAFALNWDVLKVNKITSLLESKKLIRYSLFNNNWEIFEGSSIDVSKKIEEIKNEGIDKKQKLTLLSNVLDNRYEYPKRYNDEKNMIRFATIYPVYASDLTLEFSTNSPNVDKSSDMNIFYVIPDKEIEDTKNLILELTKKDQTTLFVLPYQELLNIDDNLSKLVSIEKLLEDKYFLNEDLIVEEELLKIKENTLFTIKETLELITHFKKSYWFHNGKDLKIKSKISLSENLSNIMWDIFGKTPKINNESFNRRNISKQQLKAAKEVVDAIIGIKSNVNELKGPSKLIYASIVKNNKINEANETEEISELRLNLMNQLKLGQGDFTTLLAVFKDKPFGIREPNIPVLLTSVLKQEWKNLMFYHKDGSYINDMDGDILFDRMLDKPENYSFSYQSLNDKYKEVIKDIDECFELYIDESDASFHSSVRTNRILSKWFRSLPKITQKTNKLSKKALLFKQLIKKGEFEPDVALDSLYELDIDKNSIKLIKNESENYYDNHKGLIETTIFNLTGVNSFDELLDSIQKKTEFEKVDNKLNNLILKSNSENWVDILSFELVGVKREEWSDATDEVFFKTINSLIKIDSSTDLKDQYYEVKIENEIMAIPKVDLSSKGKLIYSNMKTDLELMGRKLPNEEIIAVVFRVLVDLYKENR
ncbi:hypothetical protein [Bacillus sp. AFS037270]|uniref:hypothetical protein n=1 Tax=Bacillus sp. AFS037270 TaxID=2033499 RepID=UPI000BFE8BE6|nr:hypothetical protein [Bacillus sp. AFS037270]PGV47033.1 hypothetical protein COD92_29245 [Bacillus sp. AFS037270]